MEDDRLYYKYGFVKYEASYSNANMLKSDIEPRKDIISRVFKVPMKWKIICAYLKGLSKRRRMGYFLLKYLFSF